MADSQFKKGDKIEISSDEDGFRGAWFLGTVIQPPPRRTAKKKRKVLVEYDELVSEKDESKRLQESVDVLQIRPIPPRETSRVFKLSEEVDAYYNDGWWEGVITDVLEDFRFFVYFRTSREQIVFKGDELRLHREWHRGEWIPPLEDKEERLPSLAKPEANNSMGIDEDTNGVMDENNGIVRYVFASKMEDDTLRVVKDITPRKMKEESSRIVKDVTARKVKDETARKGKDETANKLVDENGDEGSEQEIFKVGSLVEVTSDEDGFQGAWFAAAIVKIIRKSKFIVQYRDLMSDDGVNFCQEETDSLHIRPYPPEIMILDQFKLYEEVDALLNDGWWVGVISKVLREARYVVYFKDTGEEIEFDESQLRPHQEWIDGKWIVASQVLKF